MAMNDILKQSYLSKRNSLVKVAENNEIYQKINSYLHNISPFAIQENWNSNKVAVLFNDSQCQKLKERKCFKIYKKNN